MDRLQQDQQREKQKQKSLEKEMKKQRVRQLKTANEEEDKVIRKLEKQLKIDKTRSEKHVPKMFNDGLEYALELCLPENIQKMYTAAKEAAESDSDDGFDEDLQIASGLSGDINAVAKDKTKRSTEVGNKKIKEDSQGKSDRRMAKLRKMEGKFFDVGGDLDSDLSGVDSEFEGSDEENSDASEGNDFDLMDSGDEDESSEDEDGSSDDAPEERPIGKSVKSINKKRKIAVSEQPSELSESDSESDQKPPTAQPGKFVRKPASDSENDLNESEDDINEMDDVLEGMSFTVRFFLKKYQNFFLGSTDDSEDETDPANNSKTWEDIYGRKRDKDGKVIGSDASTKDGKYIPPHVRARLAAESGEDPKKLEKLNRLKKQLKGWLNRLSEANMYKIVTDIDNLYMQNSRYDMNLTLTSLIFESLVSNALAPERMVLEHMLLIAALHANVGSEVGGFCLTDIHRLVLF